MAGKKTLYKVIGRYMEDDEVVGYELQSSDSSKNGRYSLEQLSFLVGRGQVMGCTAQPVGDKVVFKGTEVDFDKLPTRKIATGKKQAQQEQQERPEKKKLVSSEEALNTLKNKSAKGEDVYEALKKILSTKKYVVRDMLKIDFAGVTVNPSSIELHVSENDPYIEDYRETEFYFVFDVSKSDTYYLRQKNYMSDYVYSVPAQEGIDSFVEKCFPFIGLIPVEINSMLGCFDDSTETESNAFAAYSGNSDTKNSVLREEDGCFDEIIENAPVDFVEIAIMEYYYNKNRNPNKAITLFRGERLNGGVGKTHKIKEFLSTSYSFILASEFTGDNGWIFCIQNVSPWALAMSMEAVAVNCYDEETRSEFEILIDMNTDLKIHKKIGSFNGKPIYSASLSRSTDLRENLKALVYAYRSLIKKSLLMYALSKMIFKVKDSSQINTIEGVMSNSATFTSDKGSTLKLWYKAEENYDNKLETRCIVQFNGGNKTELKTREEVDKVISLWENR